MGTTSGVESISCGSESSFYFRNPYAVFLSLVPGTRKAYLDDRKPTVYEQGVVGLACEAACDEK